MNDHEEQISRLAASLKTVDAPEGFEGAVRTRIAERRSNVDVSRPTFWLVAKFALPMVLLAVIGGFFILSSDGDISADLVPPVSDPGGDIVASKAPDEVKPDETPMTGNGVTQKPANRNGSMQPSSSPTSQDHAVSNDSSTVFPDGADPRNAKLRNVPPPTGKMDAASILFNIGVRVSCARTGCSVTSVNDGSLAAGQGISVGDQIVAIDRTAINSSTAVEGVFSVSEITLIRDGRRIVIPIRR
jgi:membrane-associated protease RseP (regulator of RpoE activity)